MRLNKTKRSWDFFSSYVVIAPDADSALYSLETQLGLFKHATGLDWEEGLHNKLYEEIGGREGPVANEHKANWPWAKDNNWTALEKGVADPAINRTQVLVVDHYLS